MRVEQLPNCVTSNGEQVFLSASVIPAPDGSWLTRIELDEGVSITNRFADEVEARQYPEKLASWLRQQQAPNSRRR
jgi:hypothetical protein